MNVLPGSPGARGAAALLLIALLGACTKREPVTAESAAAPAPAKAAATELPAEVRKVLGRWVRADGGYVLELRGGDMTGVLEAGYFNPKPIRVSRAAWMRGGHGVQVAVELNDVGYPGATYLLTYDPQGDRLAGTYTQPQMQQTFEIEFLRQKP